MKPQTSQLAKLNHEIDRVLLALEFEDNHQAITQLQTKCMELIKSRNALING